MHASSSDRIAHVTSWVDAFAWTANPITTWCSIEAKKNLYETLSKNHYARFAQWNDIARPLLTPVQQLLKNTILPSVPEVVFPQKAQEWIQSQLIGAAMELAYRDVVISDLSLSIMDLFQRGKFPCGWSVKSEDEFPCQAIMYIY